MTGTATTDQLDMKMTATAAPPEMSESYSERRNQPRHPSRLRACLVPLNGAEAIRCMTDDLAEGGIHVTIPVGYGIATGQRYELKLAAPGASLGMGPLLTAGHHATVTHTRLQIEGGQDRVGVGLRFDEPLAVPGAFQPR